MHLIVGLGNPGRRYAGTRHNVGFRVVECLAQRWQFDIDGKQLGCLVGTGLIANTRALLARPQKFMNLSGQPVRSLAGYYKVQPDRTIVVHDDLDLPFGRVQLKIGGGHGGHNGLRDLQRHLGAEFLRVRVGIGRPPPSWDSADYVLSKWTDAERVQLDAILDVASDATEAILRDGLTSAMNRFNVRPKPNSETAADPTGPEGPEEK